MARLSRLYLPGCAHHVIQRGNNREACFYGEVDYKAYLAFSRIMISHQHKGMDGHLIFGRASLRRLKKYLGGLKINDAHPMIPDSLTLLIQTEPRGGALAIR